MTMTWVIRRAGALEIDQVLPLIAALLDELGEERDDCPELNEQRLVESWRRRSDDHFVLVAEADGQCVGVVTVIESFAFYANGPYGIINEMWVAPPYRAQRLGAALVQAVVSLGRERTWSRIDVTAPESARWERTRAFYRREGFTFAGPKLKLMLG